MIIVEGNSYVIFTNNKVTRGNGGALGCYINSTIIFKESSMVHFFNNTATGLAGGMRFVRRCAFILEGNSIIIFSNNTAKSGGAI